MKKSKEEDSGREELDKVEEVRKGDKIMENNKVGRPTKNTKRKTQMEMNAAYAEKNPDHVRYLRSRSSARSFIRTKATLEDLEELKKLIKEKEKLL